MKKEFEHPSDDELTCLVEILVFWNQEPLSLIDGSRATDKAHLAPVPERIGRP